MRHGQTFRAREMGVLNKLKNQNVFLRDIQDVE